MGFGVCPECPRNAVSKNLYIIGVVRVDVFALYMRNCKKEVFINQNRVCQSTGTPDLSFYTL